VTDIPVLEPTDLAPAPTSAFAELGLDAALLDALSELGYEEPTPVQLQAIPPLLEGRDVLAEAPTGTGKTAAFALPVLQRIPIGDGRAGYPSALVLVPTRELAMQVAQAVHRYGRGSGARVLPVYGGQSIHHQLQGLRRGVDVVVATPGRAVDHLKRGTLKLDDVRVAVLDEADEMLDMGFAEDLELILGSAPSERQTALFSATISTTIARLAKRHLRDPVRVTVARVPSSEAAPSAVRQVAYVVHRGYKLAALSRLLDVEQDPSALVFARTRHEVDQLADALSGRGYDAGALHGGLSQEQRDRIMGRFRDGTLDVLVATDVAARGLDIPHVSHVVNYDVPSAPEAYVHRIGRTGRAGREGVAVTLVEPREHRLLRNIESFTRTRLEVGQLPTVADLREKRLDLLRATLREALLNDNVERFRAVIEPLADEFDLVDLALAAVSLVDAASPRSEVEADVPMATLPSAGGPRRGVGRPEMVGPGAGKPRRGPGTFGGPGSGGFGGPSGPGPGGRRTFPRLGDDGVARLYIGGGRRAGLRPGDLVGAITNEAGVRGNMIGAIEIRDDYSLVDVAASAADRIIGALQEATIRGKHLEVRPDGSSDGSGGGGGGSQAPVQSGPRRPPPGPRPRRS